MSETETEVEVEIETKSEEATSQHGKPTEGMMCLCSMEDITEEDLNYVEYQTAPSMKWKPALFEASIIDQLLKSQFHEYVSRVKKTDCQAELRRLLAAGPPVWVSDKHALPLNDGETHVIRLWFARDPQHEISAKLHGALQGEERNKLWDELKQFIIVEGKEEGDDEDDKQQQQQQPK